MLPKTEHPTFNVTLPIAGKTLKIRPMTVKDEKILMMVGSEQKDRLTSIETVLSNCLIGDVDLKTMAFIDFQYLFIHLRAISVDNIVSMRYEYNGNIYDVTLDLLKPKFKNMDTFKKHKIVKINDVQGIVFKSPSFCDIFNLEESFDPTELIVNAIDSFYFDDDVYDSTSLTRTEMIDLFDNLPAKVLKNVNTFFNNLPVMYYESSIVVDGKTIPIEVSDFSDFF